MRDDLDTEEPSPCSPQADTMEDICRGSSLDQLKDSKWAGEPVVLLNEGSFVGDHFVVREASRPGPITARDLLFRYQKQVRHRNPLLCAF
jgi:hypothetical protein